MPKVNKSSTKQDIWEAYNALLEDSTGQPPTAIDTQPTRGVFDTLQKVSDEVNKALVSALATVEKELENQNTYTKIARERHTEQLAAITEQKTKLEREMDAAVEAERQRISARKLEDQRAEEEYKYQLEKTRRQEKDAHEQKRKVEEEALKAREASLQQREIRLDELEKAVEDHPKIVEDTIKITREQTTKELQTAHQIQINDLATSNKHEKEILTIKFTTLERTIEKQNKEVSELKSQLAAAQQQLKDMAVTVIKAQRPTTSADKQSD